MRFRNLSAALAISLLPALPAVGQTATSDADTLRPGDAIRLEIWREPDLSGTYQIDERGVVVLPRLGPIEVNAQSPVALEDRLIEEYGRFLRNPSIRVVLLRRVNILGAVQNPGLYPVDPTMTIADAIAAAGGSIPTGDPNKIRLIRDGREIETNLRQAMRIADTPLRSGDQLFVPERNWFSRNASIVSAVISASVSLVIALLLR
jgi:protein involved in polysaccharide export with SLBB domain